MNRQWGSVTCFFIVVSCVVLAGCPRVNPQPPTPEEAANALLANFSALDDGDGLLSLAEAQAGVEGLNEAIFGALDLNGDNGISTAELTAFLGGGEGEGEGETFARSFGGTFTDEAFSVVEAVDGGFLVTGTGELLGDAQDLYTIRLGADGQEWWGTRVMDDGVFMNAHEARMVSPGTYLLTGTAWATSVSNNLYLAASVSRIYDEGLRQEFEIFGIGGGLADDGEIAIQPLEDGYLLAGANNRDGGPDWDLVLSRRDLNGAEVFRKRLGADDVGEHQALLSVVDGGFLLAGSSWEGEIYITLVDAAGIPVWERWFGVENERWASTAIEALPDGGVAIAARQNGKYSYLLRLDADGNLLWRRFYGGKGPARALLATSDGGILMADAVEFNDLGARSDRIYLVHVNIDGDSIWDRVLGGNGDDYANDVIETSDGGFLLVGSTRSFAVAGAQNMYVVKTDSEGNGVDVPEDWIYRAK